MDSLFNIPKVYTVLELNNTVRSAIKDKFPEQVWVCGEIQGLRPDRGKRHTYFELVQKGSEVEGIVAKVKVALFAGRKPVIDRRIQETKGAFELKNDIEVKFLCEVSLHAPTGQYSIVIVDIDTVYTLGKVAQNRLKIIEELKQKGAFEKNKLHQLPLLPLKVGLITAYDSAAYHDFTNELSLSGFAFKVLAINCHMQGALVEADLLKGLDFFNKLSPSELDVVIVTRGGGSVADLSYFDNKKIAEAIADLNFPVISAIGHQINTTITDMVAHTFCKTPTKAAQVLVEKMQELSQKLDNLEKDILTKGESLVESAKSQLQNVAISIDSIVSRYFVVHREDILEKMHSIAAILRVSLAQQNEFLKSTVLTLKTALPNVFRSLFEQLSHLEEKVSILDPKQVLRRGYSLTYKNGQIFKSIKDVEVGDRVTTVLYDGKIDSEVKKKEKTNE
ncbi:MAG: exodeoxyribonuclease VII large subunit [Candidatus Omnitrophica bacterium]|nr:exodeoxyribonuclease VII large subunit [Candidatus Omnitrophota bacterium]